MMKKIVLFLPVFFIPAFVYAESSSVNIINSVSTNSNSQIDSQTDVRIETNGKITEYTTNEAGTIEVNSKNGDSEIKINGENIISKTATKSPTPSAEKEEVYQNKEQNNKTTVFTEIKEFIEKIFSVFD